MSTSAACSYVNKLFVMCCAFVNVKAALLFATHKGRGGIYTFTHPHSCDQLRHTTDARKRPCRREREGLYEVDGWVSLLCPALNQ